jgi:hypothetical protein
MTARAVPAFHEASAAMQALEPRVSAAPATAVASAVIHSRMWDRVDNRPLKCVSRILFIEPTENAPRQPATKARQSYRRGTRR